MVSTSGCWGVGGDGGYFSVCAQLLCFPGGENNGDGDGNSPFWESKATELCTWMAKTPNGMLHVFQHNEFVFKWSAIVSDPIHSFLVPYSCLLPTNLVSSVFTPDQVLAFKPRGCPRAQFGAASSHSSLGSVEQALSPVSHHGSLLNLSCSSEQEPITKGYEN